MAAVPILGPLLVDNVQAKPIRPATIEVTPSRGYTGSAYSSPFMSCASGYSDFGGQRTPEIDDHRLIDMWNKGEWPPKES